VTAASRSFSARPIKRVSLAVLVAAALPALVPAAALADAPGVFINDVTVTGGTTATVDGSVNPGGLTTFYRVDYDLASSAWCTSGGSSGMPAHSTTPQLLGVTDSSFHDVSVGLTGLDLSSNFCVDLVATSTSGEADSGQVELSGLPTAFVFNQFPTGATTATVAASIDPQGQTTTYRVDYDLASSTWCTSGGSAGSAAHSTVPQTLGFTDASDHDVSVVVDGLVSGSTYCGQLVATNGSGSASSGLITVTFQPSPVAFTNDIRVGATTATVEGSVNPIGQTTTYSVEYGLASSTWCTSFGTDGAPSTTTATLTLGFTDLADHDVSVALTGLLAATNYCADLVAANRSGTGDGGTIQFTTDNGPPVATTGPASAVTASSATLAGTVNPSGLPTSWQFDYGTSTAYGSSTPPNGAGSGALPEAAAVALASLKPNTTYHYRLEATNQKGTTDGTDQTFTTRPAAMPPRPPGNHLKISGLVLSPSTFPAKGSARLRFTLSEAARITVAITGRISGRRVRGVCRPSAKHGKHCTVIVKKTTLTFAGTSGHNTLMVHWTSLRPGRYTATVTAHDAAGTQSTPVTFAFTITKPRKKS
jgi:hypothetical protein